MEKKKKQPKIKPYAMHLFLYNKKKWIQGYTKNMSINHYTLSTLL